MKHLASVAIAICKHIRMKRRQQAIPYLERALRVVIDIILPDSRTDFCQNMRRSTCQRAPSSSENGNKPNLVRREASEELHSQYFAKISPSDHDARIGHVFFSLGEKVRTDDETGIDRCHVVETCIFEDQGPYDGKVDVRRS